VSRHIRWSYPALSNEQSRWQQELARVDLSQLAQQLAAEGFSAVVIDRYGYDDNGVAIAAALQAPLPTDALIAHDDRYVALDLRSLANAAKSVPSVRARPVSLVSRGVGPCSRASSMNIEQIGPAKSPFNGAPIALRSGRPFRVAGWGIDQGSKKAASGIDVAIDDQAFPTLYGTDRDDVMRAYGDPRYLASGFVAEIPANALTKGEHSLSLRVVSAVGECYYSGATTTIVVE
jgi:hypothetical protein